VTVLAVVAHAAAESAPGSARAGGRAATELRRHEWVVVFRIASGMPDAVPAAELATLHAGGAVLARVPYEVTERWSEHRMLVRTRTPGALADVLDAVRSTPGVIGATSLKLPEIETGLGSPSFMSAYTAPELQTTTRDGVLVRHEVPEVLDKRDLLEVVDVPWGPEAGPSSVGGVGLNISEIFKRLKESSWRRREQRMKDAELPILPEPAAGGQP
jgi:hypothetical protein